MTQVTTHDVPRDPPVFAALSLIVAVATLVTLAVGIVGGLMHGWAGQVAMLILVSIPVCTIGTALAIISLVWRHESRSLGQAGLWLNGMTAFFGVPMVVFWLLA